MYPPKKLAPISLDAISNGTTEGLKIGHECRGNALGLCRLHRHDQWYFGAWVGDLTTLNTWIAANSPYESFSLEAILGTVFAPLMWLIGVANGEDIMLMGQLLGIKLAASEFVGIYSTG